MLFEVPYNFDEAIIPFYKQNVSHINFLYLPPYRDDSINTRTVIQTNKKGRCYMPQSREEYEWHLNRIVQAGLSFVVLWQVRDNIIPTKTLEYYCRLGASGFIVANDKNAEKIKEFNKDSLVIGSLVQRLCANITKKNLYYYDYVVLYYTFNRSLDALKQLVHIKDKIVLMPNTLCNVDCPSVHHWFPTKERPFIDKRDCSMTVNNIDKCGTIFPEHLELFDNFVGGYKLQGREYPTAAIKYICHFYFKRTYYKDFINPFLREDMARKLKELVNSVPPEEYYNTKTVDIIDLI